MVSKAIRDLIDASPKVVLSVRLGEVTHQRLKAMSSATGASINQIMAIASKALCDEFEKHGGFDGRRD